MTEPSTLKIDGITEKDEGEYRCRIDYLRSPTKNLRVKLTVVGKSVCDTDGIVLFVSRCREHYVEMSGWF